MTPKGGGTVVEASRLGEGMTKYISIGETQWAKS